MNNIILSHVNGDLYQASLKTHKISTGVHVELPD